MRLEALHVNMLRYSSVDIYSISAFKVEYVFKYTVLGTEDHINRYRTYCKKCITNITWE